MNIRQALTPIVLGVAAAVILAACQGSSSTAVASPGAAHSSVAAAASSASAFATSSAGQAAETDIKALAKACAPAGPDGQPVADPIATLITPGTAGHDARTAYAQCEKIPSSDWPKAGSCLLRWGPKAHAAAKLAIGADHDQVRDTDALAVLNFCAAYAKGKVPPEVQGPVLTS